MPFMQYILPTAAGAAAAGAGWVLRKILKRQKTQEATQNAVENGVSALLYYRIKAIYKECAARGYSTIEDVRDIDHLYQPYHGLGGNGTGTELFEKVKGMLRSSAETEEKL